MGQQVRKAVIAAAGFGTRFLPQTKAMPKEMMPVIDRPVIQVVVDELVEAGITDIIIVTGYHKRSIEDHFDHPSADLVENLRAGGESKKHYIDEIYRISESANFAYVRQKGRYGNGTPLLCAKDLVGDEPFIYTWSDDFIVSTPTRFKQLVELYNEYQSTVLSCIRATSDKDYSRYGFVSGTELREGVIDVAAIVEKPGKDAAPSELATVSGGLFTPDIFEALEQSLPHLPEGKELYYNDDGLKPMIQSGKRVIAAEITNSKYYDAGDKLEYLKTVIDFGIAHDEFGEELRAYIRSKV